MKLPALAVAAVAVTALLGGTAAAQATMAPVPNPTGSEKSASMHEHGGRHHHHHGKGHHHHGKHHHHHGHMKGHMKSGDKPAEPAPAAPAPQ